MPQPAVGQSSGDAGSSAELPSFDEAFDAAASADDATGAGDESDTDAGADTDDAGEDTDPGNDDQPPSEDTEEEGRSDEASKDDADKDGKDDEDDSIESDPKAQAMLAKLPPDLRKQWNKHFTQKSQKIAAQHKLVAAFERDPIAAAKAILQHAGEEEDGAADEVVPITAEAVEAEITKNFPKEQAEALKPLSSVLSRFLQAAVKPLQDQLRTDQLTRNANQVDEDIKQFAKDHPDYEVLEPVMNEWMDKIKPAKAISTREYLSTLRTLALGEKGVAERVKKHLAKMGKNAKSAAAQTRPVQSSTVKPGPKGLMTFEQSAEAALRGEVTGKGIRR